MRSKNFFELFKALPQPIQSYIKNEMKDSDLRILSLVSKQGKQLFEEKDRLAKIFLLRTMKCEYGKMIAGLNLKPEMVFAQLQACDFVGNAFQRISPLQYAAWAWDIKSLQIMINFNQSLDAIKKAIQQLDEVDQFRTQPSLFNLSTLINLFEERKRKINEWSEAERVAHWCQQIGQMQKKIPIAMLIAISKEIQDKAVIPIVYHFDQTTSSYFPSPPGLGLDHAFHIENGALLASSGKRKDVGEIDLLVLSNIAKEKQEKLENIKLQLTSQLASLVALKSRW